jgi:CPA1 family monovalent cation:H+ antiporter
MTPSALGLILLTACVVAILSRRLHLPYSAGLVAAGVALALLGGGLNLSAAPDLIYSVLLPPLIFEAALQLRWRPFAADLPVTLTLAFPGVLVTGGVIAVGMHLLAGWSWLGAALFGALIAATDPVAVIAAFKELRVAPRLSLLVESESLLNDGAAAVAFALLVAVADGGAVSPGLIVQALIWKILGGLAIGGLVAGAALLIAGRANDHLVETTLSTIAAYGAFLVAEHLGMSGVLAALAAGLVVGNVGWRGPISDAGREQMASFWEYAAFLANSLVFVLIGGYEARAATSLLTAAAAIAVALVLAARVATVYPLCALFARSRWRVERRTQHVLAWGGLRGALALALALAVPDSVPEKGQIVVTSFAVVAFSIFAQGITMRWLIHVLKLDRPAAEPGR